MRSASSEMPTWVTTGAGDEAVSDADENDTDDRDHGAEMPLTDDAPNP